MCPEAWRRSVPPPSVPGGPAAVSPPASVTPFGASPPLPPHPPLRWPLLPLPLGGSGGGGGGGASVGGIRAATATSGGVRHVGGRIRRLHLAVATGALSVATLPSLMGKRLARASGGWTWLAAVVFFVLRRSRTRRRASELGLTVAAAEGFMFLRRGALGMSLSHLCVAAARPPVDPDGASVTLQLWPAYPPRRCRPCTSSRP